MHLLRTNYDRVSNIKANNISNVVIDSNDVILTNLRSKHWFCLWDENLVSKMNSYFRNLDWGEW